MARKKAQRKSARPAEDAPTPPPSLAADSVSDIETIGKDATTKKERRAALAFLLSKNWAAADIGAIERTDSDSWHGWSMWTTG